MKLNGKVAIVTGAGRGLGRAIAMAFAKDGAKVVLAARSTKELELTAKQINRPGRVLKVKCDVTKESDIKNMVKKTLSKFGTIDILVNNAGIIEPIESIQKVSAKDWIRTINVNFVGTFLCSRAVLPTMIKKKHGKIINISGLGDSPLPNFSAYASSKSAIIRFTAILAEEVKQHGIDVNTLAPGGIRTKMTEDIANAGKKAGKEAERAKVVMNSNAKVIPLDVPASCAVFLASSESDGLTGKAISAVHDDWKSFGSMAREISESDLYTVRRVDPDIMKRLKFPKKWNKHS